MPVKVSLFMAMSYDAARVVRVRVPIWRFPFRHAKRHGTRGRMGVGTHLGEPGV